MTVVRPPKPGPPLTSAVDPMGDAIDCIRASSREKAIGPEWSDLSVTGKRFT